MRRAIAAGALLFIGSIESANALDLGGLMPCKAAAVRLCDRSQGMTVAALWRCGATLAARRHEIGERCRRVLVSYGQL
jgi:hypothetical protein